MLIKKLYKLNLQLFAEGAAAGAPATGGQDGVISGNGGVASTESGNEKVVYGKQPEVELGTADQNQVAADIDKDTQAIKDGAKQVDKNAEFENLIKSDYKEQFDSRVRGIIDKRFKEVQGENEYRAKSSEIFNTLAAKYGVDAKDLKALSKAIESDNAFFAEVAEQEGLTVDQYKEKIRLEKENQALKQAYQERERQTQAQHVYSKWINESEQLKQIYPNFKFEQEIQNPDFIKILQSGVSVKAAYSAIHADDIIPQAMVQTAKAVTKSVTENIRAKGLRALENGISQQAGIIVKNDVTKLTAKDREEIARRARRGENISF